MQRCARSFEQEVKLISKEQRESFTGGIKQIAHYNPEIPRTDLLTQMPLVSCNTFAFAKTY